MQNASSQEFQGRLARVEELISQLAQQPDSPLLRQARELMQELLELHGRGMEKILAKIYEANPEGEAIIDELGHDPLLSGLLLLHGLHPLDLETRVREALERVRPRLGLHGGSVALVSVTPEGGVRLKLEGNCHGCPSSRVTLRSTIEEELNAIAPDIVSLEVEGATEPLPSNRVPVYTECPLPNGNGVNPGGEKR
jgi:Fe-S cluster biogenesis protein NfuA